MKNRTKAFTLVELLSIIAILGVMTILVVPQIGGSINSKKQKELDKLIEIIENAGKAYHSFNSDEYKIPITTLVEEKFLVSKLDNPVTGEKLDGCVKVFTDANDTYVYKYSSCEVIQVPLSVDENGGTLSQSFEDTYPDGTKITLIDPTKPNSDFKEWVVVRGNSIIKNKILMIGDTATEIRAMWTNWAKLTINPNGGTTSQGLETFYRSGTIIELLKPTRAGYIFTGWTVTSGNSDISDSIFTMGSEDTVITANWEKGNLISTYSCANTSYGSNYMFTYTGDCEVIDDGNNNWRIKFLTSGTFTPTESLKIDVFLVGGGGGGGNGMPMGGGGGGGGGGNATKGEASIVANTAYTITVGAGGASVQGTNWNEYTGGTGGTSSAFGLSATGGTGGNGGGGAGTGSSTGGRGGSGGGSGGSGGSGVIEFFDTTGTYYAGGGGGGGSRDCDGVDCGAAGSGGAGKHGGGNGGRAGLSGGNTGSSGTANTGGGGGGGGSSGGNTKSGSGGSGVVIIRNTKLNCGNGTNSTGINFTYSGSCEIVTADNDNWKIRFLTSGIFTPEFSGNADVFLVGGGGGGSNGGARTGYGGGGGGGGNASKGETSIVADTAYSIVVGAGGASNGGTGGTSSAFGLNATGGTGGNGSTAGTGSSTGGRGGFNGSIGGDGIKEFFELDGSYYAGAGGGGGGMDCDGVDCGAGGSGAAGGAGGGGKGGNAWNNTSGVSGTTNAGAGGGGGGSPYSGAGSGGAGGSGIVIIRKTI